MLTIDVAPHVRIVGRTCKLQERGISNALPVAQEEIIISADRHVPPHCSLCIYANNALL